MLERRRLNRRLAFVPVVTAGLLLSAGAGAKPGLVPASAWRIGPVIDGRNYSQGPARPSPAGAGLSLGIGPHVEPHYVTFPHGSLQGKTRIRMRFRVEGPDGAIIYGAKCATGSPSAVTLFFQRADDDWRSDGGRWWAGFASAQLSGPTGETEIIAPLDGPWSSVVSMTARNSPGAFAAAKANAGQVGFTFANCEGLGHGARATTPVRLIVTRFEVM